MLTSAQFYVTLPSNASMTVYPNNTVTEYATKLPHALQLDGQWEVGLTEMTYPLTWYNVEKDDCSIELEFSTTEHPHGAILKYPVPEGRYVSARELVEEIRRVVHKHLAKLIDFRNTSLKPADYFNVVFNDKTQKATIVAPDCKVVMSPKLADLLGFESCVLNQEKSEGVSAVDLNRGYNNLFVYCNVVVDGIVGDVRAPLLRTINVRGQYGDSVREIFTKPLYIPLRRSCFDTIEISIKGETGRPVSFNSGSSCVTLHFKRISLGLSL